MKDLGALETIIGAAGLLDKELGEEVAKVAKAFYWGNVKVNIEKESSETEEDATLKFFKGLLERAEKQQALWDMITKALIKGIHNM